MVKEIKVQQENKNTSPVTTVKASNLPISPQKLRMMAKFTLMQKDVLTAVNVLKHLPNKSAAFIRKLMISGLSNAENNHNVDIDTLRIKSIQIGKGQRLRRSSQRAKGSGTLIIKPRSNVKIDFYSEAK